MSVSSEQPPGWVVDGVGTPPEIYSLEVNRWVLDAGRFILSQQDFDLVYLTTTDYAMHSYAPDEPESARHIALLDEGIGMLVDDFPDAQFLITADHGMSSKSRMPERIGDIMALGAHDIVFGDPSEVDFPNRLRSHGSTYELDVPVIAYGPGLEIANFTENRSLGQYVIDHVLTGPV